jgi:hypothetical protein
VLSAVKGSDLQLLERDGETVASLGDTVISASAYLGAEPVIEALRQGADVVVGGRIADPSCSWPRWRTSSAGVPPTGRC